MTTKPLPQSVSVDQNVTPSRNEITYFSSSSAEWYTPPEILKAARKVLGEIDLDPASSVEANEVVGATHIYTEEDDGLTQVWWGRVWLNPPYGRGPNGRNDSKTARWAQQLIDEFEASNVEAALLLVTHTPDRTWFRPLWGYPMCITHERLRHRHPGRMQGSRPVTSSAIVYFGENTATFARVFGRLGRVVLPGVPCQVCSAPMHGRADQRFCSSACRQRAYRWRQSDG